MYKYPFLRVMLTLVYKMSLQLPIYAQYHVTEFNYGLDR